MPSTAERAARQHSESISDKFVIKTATASLNVREQHVFLNSTSGAQTITLPPVGEAKGLTFSIICTVYSGAITIDDYNNDSFSFDAPSIAAANDGALLYSDGYTWWTLATCT